MFVAIAPEGELAVHAIGAGRHYLCVFSLNGHPLACMQLRAALNSLQISSCGRWLLAGSEEMIRIHELHSLAVRLELPPPREAGACSCASVSPCGRAVVMGTTLGGVYGFAVAEALGGGAQ